MKTFLNFFTGLALTTSLLMTTTGCERFSDIQPEPTPQGQARLGTIGDISNGGFDPALFAQKIEARLTGKVPGFGYRIIVNGQHYMNTGGGGKARYAIDAPELAYTANTRQDIASSSKFVTALTVLRILERNDKNANELIWPYLPTYFKPTEDFKKLRFIDLLSHTSGIVNYSNADTQNGELNDMQDAVENGIQLAEFTNQTYDYENMNYALCRLLVPYMVGKLEQPDCLKQLYALENSYAELNTMQATIFRAYIRSVVMKAAQLPNWNSVDLQNWGVPANQYTLYYPGNNTTIAGNTDPSNFLSSGPGGLVISAHELAQVVAATRAGMIVSASTLTLMKTGKNKNQLGFDDAIAGTHGVYYHKNGGNGNISSVLMDFQGNTGNEGAVNVQLVITANMGGSEAGSPSVWAKLFDESWK